MCGKVLSVLSALENYLFLSFGYEVEVLEPHMFLLKF